MTLQTTYINYKNGNLTPSKFLYEIRKKNFPFLSPNNSLRDVITILKGQKLISEVKDKNPEIPQVDCKTIDMVSPHEYTKGMNFELDLRFKSAGQNSPTVTEISKAQDKVLKNLTKDSYYYSRKLMTDEEKKYEKGNEREYELKKQFIHNNKKGIIRENHDGHEAQDFDFRQATHGAIADIIKKNGYSPEDLVEPTTWEEIEDELWYTAQMNEEIPGDELGTIGEDCGCQGEEVNEDNVGDWDSDDNQLNNRNLIKTLIEEWGLTEYDLDDDDVLDELAAEINSRAKMNEDDLGEALAIKDAAGNVQYAKDDREATNVINQAKTKGVQLQKQHI